MIIWVILPLHSHLSFFYWVKIYLSRVFWEVRLTNSLLLYNNRRLSYLSNCITVSRSLKKLTTKPRTRDTFYFHNKQLFTKFMDGTMNLTQCSIHNTQWVRCISLCHILTSVKTFTISDSQFYKCQNLKGNLYGESVVHYILNIYSMNSADVGINPQLKYRIVELAL